MPLAAPGDQRAPAVETSHGALTVGCNPWTGTTPSSIGGGHNGLACAAYLAEAGRSVVVLERTPSLGGAARSARVFPAHDALLSKYSYLVSLLPAQIVDELGLDIELRRDSS